MIKMYIIARALLGLHKMRMTLRHLSTIWSTDRVATETMKNGCAHKVFADVQIITNVHWHPRTRMNETESVVILILRTFTQMSHRRSSRITC